jgi:hypothetical protein
MLEKLHLLITTQKVRESGTKSKPVLILTENNRDLLHHTFHLPEGGIEDGSTQLLTLDVSKLNLPLYFQNRRIGIRGADAWWPEHIFLWGINANPTEYDQTEFVPMGIDYFQPYKLSTDETEGRISIGLRHCHLGGNYNLLNRLMLIIVNDEKRYAGTNNPVVVKISTEDGLLTQFDIPARQLQQPGQAFSALHFIDKKFFVNKIRSVEVEIKGEDSWMPKSFWLLALDDQPDEWEAVVPLVNIPDWQATGLGAFSADPSEGEAVKLLYRSFL